ncbi:MAG: 3-deoxy-manno-octulosonate cytidylyltransferase synthetase [Betaproteobacteria bacterium]|nr:3-deoxy-manno-octulosonate cytidylyltransferase synthetase [Betaproteobacteria bacterium]
MKFQVIIPARYASTRFPGKPLADLGGKPMVVRVCERAKKSGAAAVHVATDDERIAAAVRAHGHSVVMTREDHPSGTDRLAEAAKKLRLKDSDVVVNVQGDEPLISPQLISQVARILEKRKESSVSTACHAIHDEASLASPNVVKVVLDREGYALYFSRSRIPFPREGEPNCYRHAGIYGYRVSFLKRYARLKPAPPEKAEALEQLRVLWHGYRIAVAISETAIPPGVDTPQDLEAVRRILS